jgi:hypothetical protein
MSTPDLEEKARNREIAQNEVRRKAVSAVRLSSSARSSSASSGPGRTVKASSDLAKI